MKRWLRSLLAWMDRKWPDKVTVTLADYTALLARLTAIQEKVLVLGVAMDNHNTLLARSEDRLKTAEEAASSFSDTRLKHIESEINKFNVHMGFGGALIPKGMAQAFQR